MRRAGILFVLGFPLCVFLWLLTLSYELFGIAIALRDAFCYPHYLEEFLTLYAWQGLSAVPFLGGLTFLAHQRFRGSLIPGWSVFVPVALFALAYVTLAAGEVATIQFTRAYCAALPYPEAVDNTAPVSPLAPALITLAKILGLGFIASLATVYLLGVWITIRSYTAVGPRP